MIGRMDTLTRPTSPEPPSLADAPDVTGRDDAGASLSRRALLRVAGGGLVAAGVAAWAPVVAKGPTWTYPPGSSSGPALAAAPSGSPTASASAAASASA